MQKRWITAVIFCLAVILILAAHLCGRTMAMPAFTFAEEKEVYLTFDDGPSTKVTGSILDTLQEKHVKATFFIVGERVSGREEVLRRIVAEGHTVGVHSETHRYDLIYSSDEAFREDVTACAGVIERCTGVFPHVYRFPGGGRHPSKEAILKELGYEIVWWNAVCGDEEIPNADAETLVTTALSTAANRAHVVLLLHDSASHMATAEALPAIIDHFLENHYTFKTF